MSCQAASDFFLDTSPSDNHDNGFFYNYGHSGFRRSRLWHICGMSGASGVPLLALTSRRLQLLVDVRAFQFVVGYLVVALAGFDG